MKITNVSDRPREIAETGQHADPGETVEVDSKLGAALCRQKRVWAKPQPPAKRKTKAKPEEGDR